VCSLSAFYRYADRVSRTDKKGPPFRFAGWYGAMYYYDGGMLVIISSGQMKRNRFQKDNAKLMTNWENIVDNFLFTVRQISVFKLFNCLCVCLFVCLALLLRLSNCKLNINISSIPQTGEIKFSIEWMPQIPIDISVSNEQKSHKLIYLLCLYINGQIKQD
jgi:hypothetical protein